MEREKIAFTLQERKQKLQHITRVLQNEFTGLDRVIQELTDLISSWFFFPEAQVRPALVNMWGLTGSGKTALVKRLVQLLEFEQLYIHLDMGEYETGNGNILKDMFTDDLEYFNDKPCIICMDEFQFARTLNEEKRELGKDKLRVVWELIDSGKLSYIPYQTSYYTLRAELCLILLMKLKDKGVEIHQGIVSKGLDEYSLAFADYYFESFDKSRPSPDANYFLSEDFKEGLYYLYQDQILKRKEIECILLQADLEIIMQLLNDGIKSRTASRILNLSKALILVLGNLDEAFYMSNEQNPDIHADDLHAATRRINVSHIKSALTKRFRSEQIARLGNNHIIFHSFTSAHFRSIIEQKLKLISDFVLEKYGIRVQFDGSVIDTIYQEGVMPAHGTRPVFTTIHQLIEGNLGNMLIPLFESDCGADEVHWSCINEVFHFQPFRKGAVLQSFSIPLQLKMQAMRKPDNPQIQAHTAVHEAGHAIVAALTLRIIPALIVSRSAHSHAEGFCMVNHPEGPETRDLVCKEIMIGLGGYVAERLIFGKENTCSGVSSDIERVSELANRAIKEYAMGDDPVYVRFLSSQDDLAIEHSHEHTAQALNLIRVCEKETEELLLQNKLLLLEMSKYLTTHSRMEESMIREMILQYSSEPWVTVNAFVKKENYFQFANHIYRQLEELKQKPSAKVLTAGV